ncbi:MAG: DUF4363 family protein [Clostridiales bacterium]|nr:DUF4363 family protein [Clostridiales bacterium]
MKRLWFSAIFLILIISLCTYEQSIVKKGYENITEYIDYALETGDMAEKENYCREITNKWNKYYSVSSLMTDHSVLESANASIGMLNDVTRISGEETDEILVEAKSDIRQLYENSIISISNIF